MDHHKLLTFLGVFFIAAALLYGYMALLGDEVTGMVIRGEEGYLTLRAGEQTVVHDRELEVRSVGAAEHCATLVVRDHLHQQEACVKKDEIVVLNGLEISVVAFLTSGTKYHDRVQILVRDMRDDHVPVAPQKGEVVLQYGDSALIPLLHADPAQFATVRVTPAPPGVRVFVNEEHAELQLHERQKIGPLVVELLAAQDYTKSDAFDRFTLRVAQVSYVSGTSFDALVRDSFSVAGAEILILAVADDGDVVHALLNGATTEIPVGTPYYFGSHRLFIDHVDNLPGAALDRVSGTLLVRVQGV